MQKLIIEYFKEPILRNVRRKVTKEHNNSILTLFEPHEIMETIFSMHPDKSPGLDGINLGFYQHHWDIIEGPFGGAQ